MQDTDAAHGIATAFELQADYEPAGDQPQAIEKLVDGLDVGLAHQTLLGVTGSRQDIFSGVT